MKYEEIIMNNFVLWLCLVWDVEFWDCWLCDFFGFVVMMDWYCLVVGDFMLVVEIVKDGDDVVVCLELFGIDVDKDVNVEFDFG